MYKIYLKEHKAKYELEELIKVFLPPETYEVVYTEESLNAKSANNHPSEKIISLPDRYMEKNAAKRYLYDCLAEETGYLPSWGTLTGVRPSKMVNELLNQGQNWNQVEELLRKTYYISEEKISLLKEVCENQRVITQVDSHASVGVYVGIPFCPTRCVYCSFPSYQVKEPEIERYLHALLHEIQMVGNKLKSLNISIESIYIGGGTPTTLSAEGLVRLLSCVREFFDLSQLKEFTLEAGRPDTIDGEKLKIMHSYGVDRVSINPQSMNQKTLDLIGRGHTPEDIEMAFRAVKNSEIPLINADIIAGLPEETLEDFLYTLEKVIQLDPSNITVHTLAVKRASRLKEIDGEWNYKKGADVGSMVSEARKILAENGYVPYYMYRQKHMTGNYENVGYGKPHTESIYNIQIMDEHQTIVALGAGGISKAYFPAENRLERVPNVSNYQIYIDRIEEMIQRKEDKLYLPFEETSR